MLRYAISDGSLALGRAAREHGANPTLRPIPTPGEASVAREASMADLRHRLLTHAAFVAARQMDFFLLREPTLPAGCLANLSRDLLHLFATTGTRLLIHSRPDIAMAARAHGVHLPSGVAQLTPAHIRTLYTSVGLPPPTVSLSCHSEEDLRRAGKLEPDLILFGPIFGKQIDGISIHPGVGLDALRKACELVQSIPVLALGGVTEANAPACLDAGAAGIAAIRLFCPPRIK